MFGAFEYLMGWLIVKFKVLKEVYMNKVEAKNRYEGSTFPTKSHGEVVVLEYINSKNIVVKFLNTGNIETVRASNLTSGLVKDHNAPFVYGVGIVGNSPTRDCNGRILKEYVLWTSMLSRCYSDKYIARFPTYAGCSVSENFKYYTYFKEWCNNQIGFDQQGWHLDKDILVKGNKIYSEDTCSFLPPEINTMFAKTRQNDGLGAYVGVKLVKGSKRYSARLKKNGKETHIGMFDTPELAFLAYKQAKEDYIKQVANKWKDRIDCRVYKVLMNYEVT